MPEAPGAKTRTPSRRRAPRHPPARTPAPLPSRRQAARRERILAAARRVFADKGYDFATVDDIATAAGAAHGTFYLYFPSKKGVVIELAEAYLTEIYRQVMAAYDPARPLAESIRPMVHAAFATCAQNRDLARLFRFSLDVEAAEAIQAARARRTLLSTVAQILARHMEAGEVKPLDPEMAAGLAIGMIRDATYECYVFGDGSPAERCEDALVAFLTNALIVGN